MLSEFRVYRVTKEFYWECRRLRIHPAFKDQLIRASSSIVLNIAEGTGKTTPAHQKKYYADALGSLRECQAIIEMEKVGNPILDEKIAILGKMLFSLAKDQFKKGKIKN